MKTRLAICFGFGLALVLISLAQARAGELPKGVVIYDNSQLGTKYAIALPYNQTRHFPATVAIYDKSGNRIDLKRELILHTIELRAPFHDIATKGEIEQFYSEFKLLKSMLANYPAAAMEIYKVLKLYYEVDLLLKSKYVRFANHWHRADDYQIFVELSRKSPGEEPTIADTAGNLYHNARVLRYYSAAVLVAHSHGLTRIPYNQYRADPIPASSFSSGLKTVSNRVERAR